MAFHIDEDEVGGDHLADEAVPRFSFEIGADTPGADLIVTVFFRSAVSALRSGRQRCVLHRTCCGAVNAGENFLRRDQSVHCLGRDVAGIAITAGRMIVAEILQQHLAAAMRGLAIAEKRAEFMMLNPLLFIRRIGACDHLASHGDILQAIEHPRHGGQPIAPGATGFLVIGFDIRGQVEVSDEPHIRFVDTHAEGDGGDDNNAFILQEAVLVRRADAVIKARMIRQSGITLFLQPRGGFIDFLPRQTVDDAAFAFGLSLKEFEKLFLGIVFHRDVIADIRAVESGEEKFVEVKLGEDVFPCRSSAVAVTAMQGTCG